MYQSDSDVVLERLMSLHPKVIDLVLDRVERLLVRLDHPERKLPPVIHVAGTNGKGSVIAFMRSMLEAAGYRVHVYTSPHLVRFNERVTLNGEYIPEADLTALLEECEQVNQGEPITFFEITTCAAFLAFSRTPADVLILETGLGGRLDATNVVARPALSVITEISIDHQQFLGETIEEIAGEKAGIIKAGVPCVMARQTAVVADVISAVASERFAPLISEGADWSLSLLAGGFTIRSNGQEQYLPKPSLPGAHQYHNAAVAVMALSRLSDIFKISGQEMSMGLKTTRWPARFQNLVSGPLIEMIPKDWELWLDGGHNEAAALVIVDEIKSWHDHGDNRPVHLIFGMLNNKEAKSFLGPLAGCVVSVDTVTIPGEENALSAEDLAAAAQAGGHQSVTPQPDVKTALARIINTQKEAARVLICGSLYLAGTILAEND